MQQSNDKVLPQPWFCLLWKLQEAWNQQCHNDMDNTALGRVHLANDVGLLHVLHACRTCAAVKVFIMLLMTTHTVAPDLCRLTLHCYCGPSVTTLLVLCLCVCGFMLPQL